MKTMLVCRGYYVRDPAGFTAAWRRRANLACELTEEEAAALAERDYGAVCLGGHPHLLWSFSEAVWVPEVSRPELVESYREKARAHGYPDTST
ncbi:hypothetical protein SAMN05421505_13637 [Sinosporangium album]|uniref:Uncharacterized protein n=1 Tax=Sinosporangium album TaxID=504805 RepID=A0A1G8IBT7_9ACTN|nr:hypothetical protein [Sinosporangium album]SDI16241.1 hypothetical protein SAMN05421505_13637 [Sinosporangium album]